MIAPLSTLPHWQREFNAWSGSCRRSPAPGFASPLLLSLDMNVVVYHGSNAARELIRKKKIRFSKIRFAIMIISR